MILFYTLQFRTEREFDEFLGSVFLSIIMIALISLTIYLWKDRKETREWRKGIFPADFKFNKAHILKAYISLSASMIRRDLSDNGSKIAYMNGYFRKEFPESKIDFKDDLNFHFKYPIQLHTVCDWLNLHFEDEIYRLQVIYFLAGLSMINGSLNTNEYRLLQHLVILLKLKQKDFESIIAMYHRTNSKKKKSSRKRTRIRSSISNSKSLVCYQILGVSKTSSVEEIKKSYRKLVMKHHPDKFESEGRDQLRLAQERFLKIQEAYEYLVKHQK